MGYTGTILAELSPIKRLDFAGEPGGLRTRDPLIKRQGIMSKFDQLRPTLIL